MNPVLATVFPVFALIALGFAAARFRLISDTTGKGLSEFVFMLAAPALLFRTMQKVDVGTSDAIGLWVSYYGAIAATWILAALASRFILRRPADDGAAISMASCFGNILMLGLPMGLAYFGDEAATPMALLISLSAPLMWFTGTLHMEWAQHAAGASSGLSWPKRLTDLATSLALNPIVSSIFLGIGWRMTGLGVHPLFESVLTMLAQAAAPVALVALGVGLTAFQPRGQASVVGLMVILKLIVSPVITWMLATFMFAMPPLWVTVAVFFSACPAGANAFLFASRYNKVVGSISGAVAVGTAISAITISALLLVLGR